MVENGMIVGEEYHDPQCREIDKGYCVQCKQLVPVHELIEFANGERICRDCETEYLELQGADFIGEYVRQNEWDFYANWMFANADREEQLRIIKAGYAAEIINSIQHDDMENQKVEFCKEDDCFLQFVKEKLL